MQAIKPKVRTSCRVRNRRHMGSATQQGGET